MGSRVPVAVPLRPVHALPRIYASTALSMASYSLLVVALPFRFEGLGLSVFQYSIALAVYALGMLATESLWGAVAFRIGRPSVIVALGGVVALIVLGIGLAQSFLAFAVTLGLLGMFVIFPVPLARWLALTARGPGTSSTGAGRYGLFFGTGLVAGTSLGPLCFVQFGFLDLALVSIALFLGSVLLLAGISWASAGLPSRGSGTLRKLPGLFTRHFLLTSTLVVLFFLTYSLTLNFLQYYSVGLFGGTASEAGYVLGGARGVAVIAGLLLGPRIDRWGPARASPLGFLLMAAGALGTFVAVSYGEMIAATVLFSVGAGWLSANLLPLALGPIPTSSQGTAVGVFGSFEDAGLLVGPVLIGAVYAAYGPLSIFPVVAAVALVGSGLATALPWWTRAPSPTRPPVLSGPG